MWKRDIMTLFYYFNEFSAFDIDDGEIAETQEMADRWVSKWGTK